MFGLIGLVANEQQYDWLMASTGRLGLWIQLGCLLKQNTLSGAFNFLDLGVTAITAYNSGAGRAGACPGKAAASGAIAGSGAGAGYDTRGYDSIASPP